jgi:hypothetical protein
MMRELRRSLRTRCRDFASRQRLTLVRGISAAVLRRSQALRASLYSNQTASQRVRCRMLCVFS